MPKTEVNRMFRAFSDRTRLRILHLLLRGELCVGDIVRVLAVPQPTASRHLGYLRRAGLVSARKGGLWVFYRLTPAESLFQLNLLACLKSCFRDVPEIRGDGKALAKIKRAGGCCPS